MDTQPWPAGADPPPVPFGMPVDGSQPEKPGLGLGRGADDHSWRWAAVLSVVFALLVALWSSFPLQPRQGRLIVFAMLLAIAGVLVLRFVFAWAWRRLCSQPDLLIPVGIVVGLDQLLDLSFKVPLLGAVLAPSWSGRLPGLSLSVSLATVLNILLWAAFAAWQTDLLLRELGGERPLRLGPWRSLQQHFLRALIVVVIGVGVQLVSLIPVLALGAVIFALAIPAIGALAVVWNLATVALLPVALGTSAPLGRALADGFRLSWQLKGRWWRGLAAQLLLLGIIVLLRVHFTSSSPAGISSHTQVKADVIAFWVGGYENGNRWYTKYADALQTPAVPIATTGLALLMLGVAVAMKITVIGELLGAATPHADPNVFAQPPSPS